MSSDILRYMKFRSPLLKGIGLCNDILFEIKTKEGEKMEIPTLPEKERQKMFTQMWVGQMYGVIGFII